MPKLLDYLNQNRLAYEMYFPLRQWKTEHGEMGLYRRRDSSQLHAFFMLGEFIVYSIEWPDVTDRAIDAAIVTMTNLATLAGAVRTDPLMSVQDDR